MVKWLALLLILAAPVAAQDSLPVDKARLEVILDPMEEQPFEGQMLLATVRGEYRVRIALEDLTLPRSASFDWLQLDRDEWTVEQVDGLPTQVMRRRIAIFPQRAGNLTFPALDHRLTIFTGDGGRSEHVVTSRPLPITVEAALGQPWLPVGAIEFSEEWSKDPAMLPLGQSVTRRVVLRALGATDKMMPTQPSLRMPWLISFSSPGERSTELTPLGPVTTVVWEWTLRPKTGERGVIPAIEIPYFDTTAHRSGTVVIDASPLAYAAAPGEADAPAWQSRFTGIWYPALGFLFGLLLPAALFGPGTRLRSRAELAAVFKRAFHPVRTRRRLRRAARTGDAMALRQEALGAARDLPAERAMALRRALEPLDRMLFDALPPAPVDLPSLAREATRLVTMKTKAHGPEA